MAAKCKYCVAKLYVDGFGAPHVSYYAYRNDMYGLHTIESINDPDVLWYDSIEEAREHILNRTNECVVERTFWEGE